MNLLFKLFIYLSSNFALTLGYPNPPSNNPALVIKNKTLLGARRAAVFSVSTANSIGYRTTAILFSWRFTASLAFHAHRAIYAFNMISYNNTG